MPHHNNKTLLIKPVETNFELWFENEAKEIAACVSKNLILDFTDFESIKNKELKKVMPLSKVYKKAKKSMILIVQNIDFDSIPTQLMVVPTLQEAHDMIEFEEIERDLGF